MSQCGPDCDCPESKACKLLHLHHIPENGERVAELAKAITEAGGRCPQSCGKPWPECGCPTAEIKQYVLNSSQGIDSEGRTKRSPGYYHGRSLREMMLGLQGKD